MEEYRFDSARENSQRVTFLPYALGLVAFSAFVYWAGSDHTELLATGPLAVGYYIIQLARYRYHCNDRVLLDESELVIYDGGRARRIPRATIRKAWEDMGLIRLQVGYDSIQIQFPVQNQADLLEKLQA